MDTHIHPVSKHDLAMAYFPMASPETAGRKLRRWINENPRLRKELKKRNYNIFSKTVTSSQLRVIFNYLGMP